MCLPPTPEHYLQEIGRAGRDGRPAKAIALPLIDEVISRHSLAHSDRLSNSQLKIIFLSLQKLIEEALGDIPPEAGVDLDDELLSIDDIHVAMPVLQAVDASDCNEEYIETIFSLLEEETPSLLSVEGYIPDTVSITLKKRSLQQLEEMEDIARSVSKCGIRLDVVKNVDSKRDITSSYNKYQGDYGGTAVDKGFYAYSFGTFKFSVVRCARCMGPNAEPRHVYAALRRLQGSGELELSLDTTPHGRAMHLRIKQAGIRLFRKWDETTPIDDTKGYQHYSDVVEAIVAILSTKFSAKELVRVKKEDSMYEIMHQVSCRGRGVDQGENNEEVENVTKSPRLVLFQKLVQNYFRNGSVVRENIRATFEGSAQSSSANRCFDEAPTVIENFPKHNERHLSILSSDIASLMQILTLRQQEQTPFAVHINRPKFSDYRDLCIAKILHAIDAPRSPILQWYNHALWGKYRNYSFSSVVEAVKLAIETS